MASKLADRNRSQHSNLFDKYRKRRTSLGRTYDSSVVTMLDKEFGQRSRLIDEREARAKKVDLLNKQYVIAIQDVLNDRTLKFLVKHSQIKAPTFTSIIAGFELARASAGDILNKERKVEIEALDRLDKLDIARSQILSDRNDAELKLLGTQYSREGALDDAELKYDRADAIRDRDYDYRDKARREGFDNRLKVQAAKNRGKAGGESEIDWVNNLGNGNKTWKGYKKGYETDDSTRRNDNPNDIADGFIGMSDEEAINQDGKSEVVSVYKVPSSYEDDNAISDSEVQGLFAKEDLPNNVEKDTGVNMFAGNLDVEVPGSTEVNKMGTLVKVGGSDLDPTEVITDQGGFDNLSDDVLATLEDLNLDDMQINLVALGVFAEENDIDFEDITTEQILQLREEGKI